MLILISDLKQELKVMEKVPKPKKGDESTESSLVNGHISNPSRTQVEIETQTSLMSPQKRKLIIKLNNKFC